MATIAIRPFVPADCGALIRLCLAEGWESMAEDPQRAERVLTAPGVTTVVAMRDDELVGFAEMFSDGEIQAYLAALVVSRECRGRGIGRDLITEALRLAGGMRIDLLSAEDATGFYEAFQHRRRPGFRLYIPGAPSDE